MRFWDTSALVPLLVEESRSAACRRLLRTDPHVAVWALTSIEIASAVRRRERERTLTRDDVRACLRRVEQLTARWTEIDALGLVREAAERLLALHALSAGDALQLGAALVLVDGRPRGRAFVTADERLAQAAESEGFEPLVPRA